MSLMKLMACCSDADTAELEAASLPGNRPEYQPAAHDQLAGAGCSGKITSLGHAITVLDGASCSNAGCNRWFLLRQPE